VWTKLTKMTVREAMIELAGKPGYGEQPDWFEKIANVANISCRQARSLWRGEISEEHRAAKALKAAVKRRQDQQDLADARQETAALAARYIKAIGGMRAQDEDFFSAEIDRLERLVDRLGVLDRA